MKTPPLALVSSFVAFSNSANMVEAAASLGLSQPALTSHLKSFESYFNQDVFALEGRRKILTSFGNELKELFETRLGGLDLDINSIKLKYESPENARLKIAGRSEILNLLAERAEFEGTLIFNETDGAAAAQGVIDRKYDLAVSTHTQKAGDLFSKKLFSDSLQLVAPRKWTKDESLLSQTALTELIVKPYLSYKESDRDLAKLLVHKKIGGVPKVKKVISDWPTLLGLVAKGEGWTLAPTRYKLAGTKVISSEVPETILPATQFFALYRKESSSLPWFKLFVQSCQKAFANFDSIDSSRK